MDVGLESDTDVASSVDDNDEMDYYHPDRIAFRSKHRQLNAMEIACNRNQSFNIGILNDFENLSRDDTFHVILRIGHYAGMVRGKSTFAVSLFEFMLRNVHFLLNAEHSMLLFCMQYAINEINPEDPNFPLLSVYLETLRLINDIFLTGHDHISEIRRHMSEGLDINRPLPGFGFPLITLALRMRNFAVVDFLLNVGARMPINMAIVQRDWALYMRNQIRERARRRIRRTWLKTIRRL